MKIATIKLKDMDLDQVNDFLRFVFNERDIEVLDPDVSFTITTVRDKKDKLADKMGGSGVYRFYCLKQEGSVILRCYARKAEANITEMFSSCLQAASAEQSNGSEC